MDFIEIDEVSVRGGETQLLPLSCPACFAAIPERACTPADLGSVTVWVMQGHWQDKPQVGARNHDDLPPPPLPHAPEQISRAPTAVRGTPHPSGYRVIPPEPSLLDQSV